MDQHHPERAEQLPLFSQRDLKGERFPLLSDHPLLGPHSPLASAIGGFNQFMAHEGFSENTIKAFLSDLRLLARYHGLNTHIGELGTRDLRDFLTWMRQDRGIPCSPKTYGRRLTTIKVFFAWLTEQGSLPADPAANISHTPVSTPLPRFLFDDQVEKLLSTTVDWMREVNGDPRPHFLISLLLATGIKKNECMNIKRSDIDRSDPQKPVLYIRYVNPRQHHKERALSLPSDILPTFDFFLERYQPADRLFECTPRNLEYVLAEAAQRAGLREGLSFEMLRWTCAVHDYRGGMGEDRLRKKLGLSRITWQETVDKLEKLTTPIA
jgi:site-specific recombinase XerD